MEDIPIPAWCSPGPDNEFFLRTHISLDKMLQENEKMKFESGTGNEDVS
jgi:hypothetical protein